MVFQHFSFLLFLFMEFIDYTFSQPMLTPSLLMLLYGPPDAAVNSIWANNAADRINLRKNNICRWNEWKHANETFEYEYFWVGAAVAARARCTNSLLLLSVVRDVQRFFLLEIIHLNHTRRRYARENARNESAVYSIKCALKWSSDTSRAAIYIRRQIYIFTMTTQ